MGNTYKILVCKNADIIYQRCCKQIFERKTAMIEKYIEAINTGKILL